MLKACDARAGMYASWVASPLSAVARAVICGFHPGMTQGNSITSVAALTVIEALQRLGKPVAPLFELAGIDASAPPNAEQHIPAERYLALWAEAMQLVQDPAFAVAVGSAFDLEALEAFGFLAMSCETLRDAYERTASVRALYNVGSSWELEILDDCMRMIWRPWSVKASELAWRAVNEYQVAEMLASIRRMTQRQLNPRGIMFRHKAPRDLATHKRLLGRVPEFEADFDGFEADMAWLAEPVRGKNPKLREYFVKQCELARQAFSEDPPFAGQVRQRLAASMDGPLPSMATIAHSLGTSPRSLHRRLANEGTRYNDILDQVRRQFSERYLARPRLAVAEVAYLVGFNDASAFFKAFKRWTGATPSEYRVAALRASV
jgi:AraC-like DNA-binding protein